MKACRSQRLHVSGVLECLTQHRARAVVDVRGDLETCEYEIRIMNP